MVRWLRSLFQSRDAHGYTQAEREIFWFFDGVRWRAADPALVQRRLGEATDIDWEADTTAAQRGNVPARQLLERAVMHAFEVHDLATAGNRTTGLTRGEMLDLLHEWAEFIDALKKKRPNWPTTLPTASRRPADSPTPNGLAGNSTGTASSAAAPLSSS